MISETNKIQAKKLFILSSGCTVSTNLNVLPVQGSLKLAGLNFLPVCYKVIQIKLIGRQSEYY